MTPRMPCLRKSSHSSRLCWTGECKTVANMTMHMSVKCILSARINQHCTEERSILPAACTERRLPPFHTATMCVSWRTGRQAVGRHTPWWDPSCWRSSQGCSRRHSRVSSPRLLLSSFGEMRSVCFMTLTVCDDSTVQEVDLCHAVRNQGSLLYWMSVESLSQLGMK